MNNIENTKAAQKAETQNVVPSKGRAIWEGTKTVATYAVGSIVTAGLVVINVAAVALPLAACVKYLRED